MRASRPKAARSLGNVGVRLCFGLALAPPREPAATQRAEGEPDRTRLGRRTDDVAGQSALARAIHRDHWLCLAALLAFLALRLVVGAAEL